MHFFNQTGGSARMAGGWMLCAALLLPSAVVSAQGPVDPEGVKLGNVQVALDPLRAEWRLGEPVFVYLHVLNRATRAGRPVAISCRANFDFADALTLMHSFEGQSPQRYISRSVRGFANVPAINFTVPAGGYWSYLLTVCHDVSVDPSGGFAFKRPGEYELSGSLLLDLNNQQATCRMRPCTITIKPPQGLDAEIYRKTLHQREFAQAMQFSAAHSEKTRGAFELIASKHPRSVYYPIAQLCLARSESKKFQYRSALERCQKILAHQHQSVPRERTLYLQAECALGVGDTTLLYDSLLAIWTENPGCFLISEYNHLYSKYLIGPHSEMVRRPWQLTE